MVPEVFIFIILEIGEEVAVIVEVSKIHLKFGGPYKLQRSTGLKFLRLQNLLILARSTLNLNVGFFVPDVFKLQRF